jgi:superfamily II DNA or RNA helicase
MKLYPYQEKAIAQVATHLQKDKSTLLCLPTGGGKTITATSFIDRVWYKDWRAEEYHGLERVLWIVHRIELLGQAEATIRKLMPGRFVTRWTSEEKDDSGQIVLAMIGSTKGLKGRFGLVIIDEGHHVAKKEDEEDDYTSMYLQLLAQISYQHLLGLTATPERLDRRPLVFDSIAAQYSFLDLVKMGRLSQPIYHEMRTHLKFQLKTANKEFTQTSLRQLDTEERNKAIVKEWANNKDRYGKTLLFAVDVKHCMELASAFIDELGSAEYVGMITGHSGSARKGCLDWFSEGDHTTPKVLINCQVFIEGLDEPSINTVFLTRPTKSKSYWLQMVGRGARIIYDTFSCPASELMIVDKVGDDGVADMRTLREPLIDMRGEILSLKDGIITVRRQVNNTFNLVSVMDDISHYPSLVRRWSLGLKEPTKEERAAILQEDLEKEKKAKLKQIAKDLGRKFQLGSSQIVDVVGVLAYANQYDQSAIVLDEERFTSIRRLETLVGWCMESDWSEEAWELFHDAFPMCVPNGELPFKVFESIKWSYYWHFVKRIPKIDRKGKDYHTWLYEYIAPVDMPAETVKASLETERAANAAFNKYYGLQDPKTYMEPIYERAIELAEEKSRGASWALRMVVNNLIPPSNRNIARNRVFLMLYDGKPNFKESGFIKLSTSLLTKAAQQITDNPSIIFRIKTQYGRY